MLGRDLIAVSSGKRQGVDYGELIERKWNSFPNNSRTRKVSFDHDAMWLELADGRKLGVPLAYFPRLLNAAPEQREAYEISGGGTGLHWDEIDEDINVEYLLLGVMDRTRPHKESQRAQAA